MANFNASHLTELKKARPDNIPMGECYYFSISSDDFKRVALYLLLQ